MRLFLKGYLRVTLLTFVIRLGSKTTGRVNFLKRLWFIVIIFFLTLGNTRVGLAQWAGVELSAVAGTGSEINRSISR